MRMPTRFLAVLLAALLLTQPLSTGCASSGPDTAAPKASQASTASAGPVTAGPPPPPLPACYLGNVNKADRFADADYSTWMLGNGLRQAPPEKLFERMKAAADSKEQYKALYFSRLITDAAPNLSGAWTNRAAFADALGLGGEANLSRANSDSGNSRVIVHGGMLPGTTLSHRPTTLSDWAAAMSLLADDTAAREGSAVVAVRDDVTGVEEVQGENPQVNGRPISLDDLLANAFVLKNADPMKEHNTRGGMLALGIAMAALGGVSAGLGDAASAAAASTAATNAISDSSQVMSHWKDGSYTARTYSAGQPTEHAFTPKASGSRTALGLPQPVLWASAGSLEQAASLRLVKPGGSNAKVFSARFVEQPPQRGREMTLPDLSYPRLASICLQDGSSCTIPVSLGELLLQGDDLTALAPNAGVASALTKGAFDLSDWNQAYEKQPGALVLKSETFRTSILGFDHAGACYTASADPGHWFVAASSAAHAPGGSR